jgi:catechol 2,3-dioxygenase-like lactoylglutathione lyase family enzyme
MAGLGDIPVAGVLRAQDFQRARTFYTEVLGLKEVRASSALTREAMFAAGAGTMVRVYERPGLPAPANTTLGFGVPAEKFDGLIAELRANGVVFEDYDMPEIGLKTVNGVAEFDGNKVAWFKDSEGNILNLGAM